ncbi:alpha/beta fold hydrolase [Shewanella amazonensis]|uniref:Alpha/beta hydrolase fold n=1 Tax=Shewanella amazonensis (strain ATCC BAA-1098 / SB2B) TaxID=326297 RepID=A1S645_SHEAM|nr:alpha/beta hydrolase [Shewanella amazonensis]ABL99851.1 alpha/beta hydrolase fold [Shewanella amazonensis SB2B]
MNDFEQYRKTFTLPDTVLSYLDMGTGPVLLLGHSYLWDSMMWQEQLALLAKDFRVIAVDLHGHGQSGPVPARLNSLTGVAQDMLALMDSINVDTFSIVGLSVGAMWGAELVLLAPSRVQAFVMMDSFIGFEPEITRAKYFGMLDVIKATGSIPAPMIDAIVPLFFSNNPDARHTADFAAHLATLKGECIADIERMGRLVFGRRDTLDDVEQLTLPVLVMVGVEDKARSVLESYLMHEAIDGSTLVHIPAAGHISCLENPQFVNEKLLSFLTAQLK